MAQNKTHRYVSYVDMGDGWFVPEINIASLFEKELDKKLKFLMDATEKKK
ncbi:MAG: hypothetical protein II179_01265 [Alphaproteobacteria bacterium]|nr:hypothetical protein [Alphaproteobacteria bacterium]